MTARSRIVRSITAGAALVLIVGCGTGEGPDPEETAPSDGTSSSTPGNSGGNHPEVTSEEARRSLASIDPCTLLTPPSDEVMAARYAEGPHRPR